MKVHKITSGMVSYIDDDPDVIGNIIKFDLLEQEAGDVITIHTIEMSQEEFENLPEFDGF